MKKLLLAFVSALAFALPAWAVVDINTASQAELEKLNGVGPAKAKAIVEYRKQHGQFKSTDDLEKVPGFGKKTTDKLKKDIAVGNPKAAAAGKVAEDKVVKEAKPAMEKAENAAKPEKVAKEKGSKK